MNREMQESQARRRSDRSPIAQIIGPIEAAFASGDLLRTQQLLEEQPVVAWFGFPQDRFGEILNAVMREHAPSRGFVASMGALLRPDQGPDAAAEVPDPAAPPSAESLATELFALRRSGRVIDALRVARELSRHYGTLQMAYDASLGWGLFSMVQHGITTMLAGEFAESLATFAIARMQNRIPALTALSRDAHLKPAVIEALYGDPRKARQLIDAADQLPRTESWVEDTVDATRTIAVAALHSDDPERALRMLDEVPMHAVGEMWPFYIAAVHRQVTLLGDPREANRRLAPFVSAPGARDGGQGFVGSVLSLCDARMAIVHGDLARAARALADADPALPVTAVLTALLELLSGKARQAQRSASELRAGTRDLRTLDLWRLAVIAGSHLALGETDDCRTTLALVLDYPGGLQPAEARYFSRAVRELAEAEVPGWPILPEAGPTEFEAFPAAEAMFTEREVGLLAQLASGRTRAEIARSEFISVNTLKAHLSSIYRKLGVGSRAAAIVHAERRGLL